jgi:sarcosine oxidase subunit gamma
VAELVIFEATIASAWNVQGEVHGLSSAPNAVTRESSVTAFWLGPRSWLVLGEPPRDASAAFDVSASRVAYTLIGPRAATVLNKHCPLDFHATAFPPATCAQSLFGQVNALYYRHAASDAITLFVARSFARDVARHLEASAAQYGSEWVPPRPFVAD